MRYKAIIDGQPLEIELQHADAGTVEAKVGNQQYSVRIQPVEPGVYWLQWKDRSIEVSVSPNGDGYIISLDGQRVEVEILDPRAALRKASHHGHAGTVELRAPMPGKVVKVLVHEGDAVELNQGLLVIEAMKMQNEVKSPKKGIVRKIGVKETAAVNSGDLLIVVE